jgi:hypothetical protein
MPQLKWLVIGYPPRQPKLELRSGHVGFLVDQVSLRRVFSKYFDFLCQSSFNKLLPY